MWELNAEFRGYIFLSFFPQSFQFSIINVLDERTTLQKVFFRMIFTVFTRSILPKFQQSKSNSLKSLFLFLCNYLIFLLFDLGLRARAQISSKPLLTVLFTLSTIGAIYYHNAHQTSCSFGTDLTKSAFLQFIALSTKCLMDFDYLLAYGTIQIKFVWIFLNCFFFFKKWKFQLRNCYEYVPFYPALPFCCALLQVIFT